jgi:hypothetical protein
MQPTKTRVSTLAFVVRYPVRVAAAEAAIR